MPLFTSAPASLCVLRLSAIGDVCNTIAAIQAIQEQWPKTKITWITGSLEAKLLDSINGIEVIVFDKKSGWKGYQHVWRQLKDRKFDALLHMQYALRASILTLGIKATYKLGFDKNRSQDFQHFFTNIKVPSPKKTHVLDGLMAFCETLGCKSSLPSWNLHYSKEDEIWAKKHLKPKRNLIIVPATSKEYKNWHAQGYSEVIEHASNHGWNIILAGSPAQIEVELGLSIETISNKSITNLIGQSNILQMLALLDLADLVIAPDTGPTHMANAMMTPVIGLYAHHNPMRTGPYNYQHYVVSAYEEAIKIETGKTSNQLNWRKRVKDEKAMHRVTVSNVINMFDYVVKMENI